MKKSNAIYIGIAVILIVLIFLFVPTKSTTSGIKEAENSSTHRSFAQVKEEYINRQKDSLQTVLNNMEETIANAKDSFSKINAYTQAINTYNELGVYELSAYNVYKKAEVIKNTNSWEIAGDNFIKLLISPELDTNLVEEISQYATNSFANSFELDSLNIGAKMKLAQCYMELKNEPMQGVQLLLDIVRKDENNIDAQLLLSKFGLISGQVEKVKVRLEKVLSLQPQNVDALLMRAEMYANNNENQKAIQDLKKVKSLSLVPDEMKKQLESAIEGLKNKK